jgi:hypothetical protein
MIVGIGIKGVLVKVGWEVIVGLGVTVFVWVGGGKKGVFVGVGVTLMVGVGVIVGVLVTVGVRVKVGVRLGVGEPVAGGGV